MRPSLTVNVYVTCWPACTGSGAADCEIQRLSPGIGVGNCVGDAVGVAVGVVDAVGVTGGVGVRVGVAVGVPVTQEPRSISENALTDPLSRFSGSLAFSVQVPSGSWPSNGANGLFGETEPC